MFYIRIFIPFALGYYLSYLLRVVNAVIAPNLAQEIGLDAADLGLLTSVYFLAFAAFQLPLGILLDRYGPRKSESGLLLFAAMGAIVFATATTQSGLIFGRALIGLGTSACLMAAFKAYLLWFPKERIPLINGFQMAAGGLGALTGTVPVEMSLAHTDWRGVMMTFAGVAVLFSAVIYFVVPRRDNPDHGSETFRQQLSGIKTVFTSPFFWRIVPLCVASQAAFLSTQSLWAGPWLSDVAGLDRQEVASTLLLIAASMVAGFLGLGTIADHLNRRGIKTMRIAIIGVSVFVVVQMVLAAQWVDVTTPAWMLFGGLGTAGILPYAVLSQSFPTYLSGRVITGINLLAFLGAFLAQWGMGLIINMWPQTGTGGYHPDGYSAAFITLIILQIIAIIWYGVSKAEANPEY